MLANDLPSDPISHIAERVRNHTKPKVWLWADDRAAGYRLLSELHDKLGGRLVKSRHVIELPDGGKVFGRSAANHLDRPDGKAHIAIWMANSIMPDEYKSRLIHLGQCEEFWARPGTVLPFPDGADWRRG